MPCGCGRATTRAMTRTLTRTPKGGAYPLYHYPGCTTLHAGAFQGTSIFVVGRGRPEERMFPRSALAEASAYANETKADIENVPTAALCDQAVTDLLAN